MTVAAAAVVAAEEALAAATGAAVRLGAPSTSAASTWLPRSSRTSVLRVPVETGDGLPGSVVVTVHLDLDGWETRALQTWRGVVSATVPAVRGPALDADPEVAEAGWAAISTSWFLPRALTEEAAPPGPGRSDPRGVAPSRRAVLQRRLARVAAGSDPRLADWRVLASALLDAILDRWGSHPLPLAPAFRGD